MRIGSTLVRSLFLILLVLWVVPACTLTGGGSLLALTPSSDGPESVLNTVVEWVVVLLEGAGIFVIVAGALVATGHFLTRVAQHEFSMNRYHRYREQLGEVILLGLEFLVAADIVGTVAVRPNIENVIALAAIILVRTFLSFTLEVETTGYWPWQRGGQSRIGVRERVRQSDSEAIGGRARDEDTHYRP